MGYLSRVRTGLYRAGVEVEAFMQNSADAGRESAWKAGGEGGGGGGSSVDAGAEVESGGGWWVSEKSDGV